MSKAAKQRFCPAGQRSISPAECGEFRGSRYACPAGCLYSPLATANYGMLLALEKGVDDACMARVGNEAERQPQLWKELQKALAAPSAHALHAFFTRHLFFRRDAGGLTTMDHWEREGFPGLKNDQRVLLRAKMRMRVALLEIHRIFDSGRVEVVDLLEAEAKPVTLFDRSLAAVACRFSTILAWTYALPHYGRLGGTIIVFPETDPLEPLEVLHEIARHLGGPEGEGPLRLWLAENFVRVDEALAATARMRHLQMLAGLDAQFGKAVYELRAGFAACRACLDEVEELEHDALGPAERDEGFAEARVWFATEDPVQAAGGRPALGRVLLGQSHCRLEAMGAERLACMRRQFEAKLGERVRFTGEVRDDLAAKLAGRQPAPDLALIPPKLLEHPRKIILGSSRIEAPPPGTPLEEVEAGQIAGYYKTFLEDQIPALDNHTPRQAARDPALRPRLLGLLKTWVRLHDERNLRTGRQDDINWLLRELGADEILFDPPPARPKQPDNTGDQEEEACEADEDLPLPVLPPEPFPAEEALARLRMAIEEYELAQEALDELEAAGSTFIDDAQGLCDQWVKPEDFEFLVPLLIQARFAFVPRGYREPPLDFDRLAGAFDGSLDQLHQRAEDRDPPVLFRLLESGPQPALVQLLAVSFSNALLSLPKKERPDAAAEGIMILVLKHMTEEMDRTLREEAP
jgi:hypothetical protein